MLMSVFIWSYNASWCNYAFSFYRRYGAQSTFSIIVILLLSFPVGLGDPSGFTFYSVLSLSLLLLGQYPRKPKAPSEAFALLTFCPFLTQTLPLFFSPQLNLGEQAWLWKKMKSCSETMVQ